MFPELLLNLLLFSNIRPSLTEQFFFSENRTETKDKKISLIMSEFNWMKGKSKTKEKQKLFEFS